MSRGQLTIFKIGCYAAFATAALHMTAHLAGPQPSNDAERQLLEQMRSHQLGLPGAPTHTFQDLMLGYSLLFALTLALTGGLGLMVARRGVADATLTHAFVRALAGGYVVMTVISLQYFFIIPTVCLGLCAVAFIAASWKSTNN